MCLTNNFLQKTKSYESAKLLHETPPYPPEGFYSATWDRKKRHLFVIILFSNRTQKNEIFYRLLVDLVYNRHEIRVSIDLTDSTNSKFDTLSDYKRS